MNNANLPGRLGNPDLEAHTDPRCDPRLAAALAMAADQQPDLTPPSGDASYEECLAYAQAFEDADLLLHGMQEEAMPDFSHIDQRTEVIKGVDGNDIKLYVHRPTFTEGAIPCLVHTHGGGMVLMTASDPLYRRWRNSLAETGIMVVGVEFRNGGGRLGNHPFPAGLNDCASGVRWVSANRESLGVSNIVVSGESGGGNLSSATAIKALKEGWIDEISGVYAQCPYVCGDYADPPAELLSLVENDGYSIGCDMMVPLVKVYDPDGSNAKNPLAWPMQAETADLKGLPPHAISVNELDPLRDEGLMYARKLLAAGVSVSARTINGTTHGSDEGLPDLLPDVFRASVESVSGFVKSLA